MLTVAAPFQRLFAQLGLDSRQRVMERFVDGKPPPRTRTLIKQGVLSSPDGEPVNVFYKQYEFAPPSWRFFARPSKARCEFRNYETFRKLGVPSAEPLACGELRDRWGRLRSAFILTRAIPDAVTLDEFFQRHPADTADDHTRALRDALLAQLSETTRLIHDAGFFHHDLVWRNLLITWSAAPAAPAAPPKLWWIDCPRGRFDRWSPWRSRRRVKDLASLDKTAAQLCTPRERITFVKRYLGKARLDAEAKQLIRAAVAYRLSRWPDSAQEALEASGRPPRPASAPPQPSSVRRALRDSLRTGKRQIKYQAGGFVAVFDREFVRGGNHAALLDNIDALMDQGRILKKGRTCHLSRVTWNGRDVVIKRYNNLGVVHSLRHTIRGSRARRCWLNGLRLTMLGIPTPRPFGLHRGALGPAPPQVVPDNGVR